MIYDDFSLRAKNFKCFGSQPKGFDTIKIINLIVGRNNSGKSTLIDLVELATGNNWTVEPAQWHRENGAQFFSESPVTAADIRRAYPSNTSGGGIRGDHQAFGQLFVGGRAHVQLGRPNVLVTIEGGSRPYEDSGHPEYGAALASYPSRNPFNGKHFQRLAAERNIVPELDSAELAIDQHGNGLTNAIQHFLNKSNRPSALVQTTVLNALNQIFAGDGHFTTIVCRQHLDSKWEIYLDEKDKGRIALSQSGSGLKTIILVLCFIYLVPAVAGKELSNFVFAFEELENHLHPALQRRLLSYLADEARSRNFPIFVTTHSSVAIDLFNKQLDAQILHVTHDGQEATCTTVKAYVDFKGVLDDLDVRASDLLQSNGIIWVEGPSDRIYLKKWIELWSEGTLTEGNHYQCVFYGGRLLAHLSGQIPDERVDEGGVSILRVNRNAAVIVDSDRRKADDEINQTKMRIVNEIDQLGGMTWVTDGKEVENYISSGAVAAGLGIVERTDPQADIFQSFFDYLNQMQAGVGDKFVRNKPLLAELICAKLSRNQLTANVKLAEKLNDLCDEIRRWNGIA